MPKQFHLLNSSHSLLLFLLLTQLAFCLKKQTKQDLLGSNLEGKWLMIDIDDKNHVDRVSPFSEFYTNAGDILIYFTSKAQAQQTINGVVLSFLMPEYYDQKIVELSFQFSSPWDEEEKKWSGNCVGKYKVYESTNLVKKGAVRLLYIVDENSLVIQDQQSTFSIVTNYWQIVISPKTSLIFTFFAFMILIIIKRNTKISETNIRHQIIPLTLSCVMLLVIACCEIIIGLRSLFGQINPQAFFFVSGCLNISILFHIGRFYGPLILKNKLKIILIWGLGISYIWFLLYFRHNYICLIINSLIFVPEILFHAFRGQKIQSDFRFYFFVSSNQVYILYFKVCPMNIFRESPNYLLGYCLCGLLVLQIGISAAQITLGPRCFIPSIFLPSKHNYYDVKMINSLLNGGKECYICLQQFQSKKYSKRKLMVTPCKHVFHADCLEGWMLVKMQCPIDRSVLAPL